MSKNHNSFTAKDKGFYIALIVCAVAVGIGIWAMLNFRKTDSLVSAVEPVVSEDVFNPDTFLPSFAATPKAVPTETPKTSPKSKPTTFMWPVSGEILVPYSANALTYNTTMADWRTHPGICIKSDIGTGVNAIADGKVLSVESGGMAGTTVKIEHSGGIVSVYSNLADNIKLKAGNTVEMGSLIGSVGQTSISEAGLNPHLHFEMTLNGNYADPMDYLPS